MQITIHQISSFHVTPREMAGLDQGGSFISLDQIVWANFRPTETIMEAL
jgi:hypothetical protein